MLAGEDSPESQPDSLLNRADWKDMKRPAQPLDERIALNPIRMNEKDFDLARLNHDVSYILGTNEAHTLARGERN